MYDGDGRCGPYFHPSKNIQAETNMDYRNDRVDWIYCPGFEDRYSAFFAVYIDFICDVILPNFPLFS